MLDKELRDRLSSYYIGVAMRGHMYKFREDIPVDLGRKQSTDDFDTHKHDGLYRYNSENGCYEIMCDTSENDKLRSLLTFKSRVCKIETNCKKGCPFAVDCLSYKNRHDKTCAFMDKNINVAIKLYDNNKEQVDNMLDKLEK